MLRRLHFCLSVFFKNKIDMPTSKHSWGVICKTRSKEIFESSCHSSSVNPAESNNKSRLKPCAPFSDFARMVCIRILFFIRPQTNRIQAHQIINSSEFPTSSLKHFPSYISSHPANDNIPLKTCLHGLTDWLNTLLELLRYSCWQLKNVETFLNFIVMSKAIFSIMRKMLDGR